MSCSSESVGNCPPMTAIVGRPQKPTGVQCLPSPDDPGVKTCQCAGNWIHEAGSPDRWIGTGSVPQCKNMIGVDVQNQYITYQCHRSGYPPLYAKPIFVTRKDGKQMDGQMTKQWYAAGPLGWENNPLMPTACDGGIKPVLMKWCMEKDKNGTCPPKYENNALKSVWFPLKKQQDLNNPPDIPLTWQRDGSSDQFGGGNVRDLLQAFSDDGKIPRQNGTVGGHMPSHTPNGNASIYMCVAGFSAPVKLADDGENILCASNDGVHCLYGLCGGGIAPLGANLSPWHADPSQLVSPIPGVDTLPEKLQDAGFNPWQTQVGAKESSSESLYTALSFQCPVMTNDGKIVKDKLENCGYYQNDGLSSSPPIEPPYLTGPQYAPPWWVLEGGKCVPQDEYDAYSLPDGTPQYRNLATEGCGGGYEIIDGKFYTLGDATGTSSYIEAGGGYQAIQQVPAPGTMSLNAGPTLSCKERSTSGKYVCERGPGAMCNEWVKIGDTGQEMCSKFTGGTGQGGCEWTGTECVDKPGYHQGTAPLTINAVPLSTLCPRETDASSPNFGKSKNNFQACKTWNVGVDRFVKNNPDKFSIADGTTEGYQYNELHEPVPTVGQQVRGIEGADWWVGDYIRPPVVPESGAGTPNVPGQNIEGWSSTLYVSKSSDPEVNGQYTLTRFTEPHNYSYYMKRLTPTTVIIFDFIYGRGSLLPNGWYLCKVPGTGTVLSRKVLGLYYSTQYPITKYAHPKAPYDYTTWWRPGGKIISEFTPPNIAELLPTKEEGKHIIVSIEPYNDHWSGTSIAGLVIAITLGLSWLGMVAYALKTRKFRTPTSSLPLKS